MITESMISTLEDLITTGPLIKEKGTQEQSSVDT